MTDTDSEIPQENLPAVQQPALVSDVPSELIKDMMGDFFRRPPFTKWTDITVFYPTGEFLRFVILA
jgi:hypothetical protein